MLTTSCGAVDSKYIWIFCMNWNQTLKGYDVIEIDASTLKEQIIRTEYFDAFTNEKVEVTPGDNLMAGYCIIDEFDYEKLVLCAPNGDKVLVESWTDIRDPEQERMTRYFNLTTGSLWNWDPSTLVQCITEKFDIQTKQYCDQWETVYGSLVFNVGWTSPVLIGISYYKINWSAHTPVSPIEWACEIVQYNTNTIIEITTWTYNVPANTYHAVSLTVVEWTASITIWGNTVSNLPVGYQATYQAKQRLTNVISITPWTDSKVVLTFIA